MVRYICSLYFFLLIVAGSWAQENKTLITIGNTDISLGEFEQIYNKNNSSLFNEADKKTPAEYLELYINFKLKVIEAMEMKLDTAETFINELAGYRQELVAPYLTNVNFEEKMVEEIYNRMMKEVNASHILILADKEASPEQENQALEKTFKIRNEILAGKNFNDAAVEYSEDPSAKTNQGNLGYFTAFQMVAPFEDAAYSTPVGNVSEPVRTSYGYHLLQIHDKRLNQGEIKVAHIMKMFPQGGASEAAKTKLKAEIDSIYNEVKQGADFAELAKKYSDDKNSGSTGGEMPWFSSGRMIPEFSNPAFNLINIGDFTQPVETPYGYHIIKKIDQKPTPTLNEIKHDIETRIKRDPDRSTSSKKAFIDKLKTEYRYSEITENIELLKNLNIGNSIAQPEMILFTLDGNDYPFNQLENFIAKNNIGNSVYNDFFEPWVEDEITKYEDSKLEEKYPDFKYLMQEYHDGILLFNISEEKIWNYASRDTTGLLKFYSKNKGKYNWEERFKGFIAVANTTDLKVQAEEFFASGMNDDEVSDILNHEKKQITITEGNWEKGANPIIDFFVWNGPEPQYFVAEHTLIHGDRLKPEPKNLEEARGHYISDYQNYLEAKWIKQLRKKYKIKINKKLFKTIQSA